MHRVGVVRGAAVRHRGRLQDLRRVVPRPRPPGAGPGRGQGRRQRRPRLTPTLAQIVSRDVRQERICTLGSVGVAPGAASGSRERSWRRRRRRSSARPGRTISRYAALAVVGRDRADSVAGWRRRGRAAGPATSSSSTRPTDGVGALEAQRRRLGRRADAGRRPRRRSEPPSGVPQDRRRCRRPPRPSHRCAPPSTPRRRPAPRPVSRRRAGAVRDALLLPQHGVDPRREVAADREVGDEHAPASAGPHG